MEDPRTPPNSQTPASRYRIVEKLGFGGNGVVYKAEDTRLGRFVALKFLSPEGQRDSQAQARFQREARAASALNHHNICTVFDIGEQDGQTFIAMELLEGQTLKEKLGSRPLPLETLLDYAMQIAAALEIAHKNGIAHRDVKPSNIFITSRGEVKLADFGLAKHVLLDSTPTGDAPTLSAPITERGAIVGTVAYMSPEQAQDKDIDARSDIFSFGIVLYEMATGKRAFPGESPATIIGEILHKEPKPIRDSNPLVPEELQRIVVKTLEKDREDRYQTAHELMVDLRRLMKKETERSQTVLPVEPPNQQKSRKWIWIAAATVVCAAVWLALTGRGAPVDSAPLPMEQLTFSGESKSSSIFTDGSRIYFVSAQNPVEMSVKGGATAPLRAAIGTMNILDISPDGSEFLLWENDLNDETQRGTLWIMPVLGGAARRLGNITGRGASYSPDGKLIAFNEKESVYVCDTEGQNVKEVWNTHHMVPGNPAFSPDSKKLRVTVSKSTLETDLTRIWELNLDGSNPHLLPLPQYWPEDSATYGGIWTPGGKHFVFGAFKDGSNHLYEYLEPRWYEFWNKPHAVRLTSGQPEVTAMAPSRDGNGMFVVARLAQGSLHFYDEKEKRFLPYLEGLPATQLVVSPDRKWMAYTDYPRGLLWRCKLDGSEKLQLTITNTYAQMLTWSPDSKWIAYSDWHELYRVGVDGGAPEKLTSEGFTEVLPSWLPDGKSIYFNDYPIAGHLRISVLDLQTRKVSTMPGSDGYYAPLWSPDGQYLAAIQNPPKSLAIYSMKTKQWKQLKIFEHDWGFFVWAPDSKSLYLMRGPEEAGPSEQKGIYRLTVPDGKWELFAKFTGLNPLGGGVQDFVSVTPEGNVATMSDTSVTQIYQMKWKNTE
jgi:eukaryotic-like serine/threonine-protein kinase